LGARLSQWRHTLRSVPLRGRPGRVTTLRSPLAVAPTVRSRPARVATLDPRPFDLRSASGYCSTAESVATRRRCRRQVARYSHGLPVRRYRPPMRALPKIGVRSFRRPADWRASARRSEDRRASACRSVELCALACRSEDRRASGPLLRGFARFGSPVRRSARVGPLARGLADGPAPCAIRGSRGGPLRVSGSPASPEGFTWVPVLTWSRASAPRGFGWVASGAPEGPEGPTSAGLLAGRPRAAALRSPRFAGTLEGPNASRAGRAGQHPGMPSRKARSRLRRDSGGSSLPSRRP
jgi:hypothetical protein